MKIFLMSGVLALICLWAGSANAVPITSSGELVSGNVIESTAPVVVSMDEVSTIHEYWTFYATAGDLVIISINRLENMFDPWYYVYEGSYGNTDEFGTFLRGYDNVIDELLSLDGPFSDPSGRFRAKRTGLYTIDVSGTLYSSESALYCDAGCGGFDGPWEDENARYRLSIQGNTRVPEPTTLGLLGLSLTGFALYRRNRK